jgi:hypothetical protein
MTTAASWEEVGTAGVAATDSSASTEIDPRLAGRGCDRGGSCPADRDRATSAAIDETRLWAVSGLDQRPTIAPSQAEPGNAPKNGT